MHAWYHRPVLYHMAWNISESCFLNLVRFRFAAVVVDVNAFEPEMILVLSD